MRFTSKGIGWLIAGGLICASALGDDSIESAIGTFLLGFVFVAVYLMRQLFKPVGIGWFIAGGVFLAFSIETMLGVTGGIFKEFNLDRDDLSTVLIGLIVSAGFMFLFYKKNRTALTGIAEEMGMETYADPADGPGPAAGAAAEEAVFEPEDAAADAEGVPADEASGNEPVIEFEVAGEEESKWRS